MTGGCCGLAGSWGFEKGKYGISMDCGEQALLPAVRAADEQTAVVANGFSCKTQIADAKVGREALHVAQLMTLAREHGRQRAAATASRSRRSTTAARGRGPAPGGPDRAARARWRPVGGARRRSGAAGTDRGPAGTAPIDRPTRERRAHA